MLRKELQSKAEDGMQAATSAASEDIIYKIDIPANR
jgi:hypothetical protein